MAKVKKGNRQLVRVQGTASRHMYITEKNRRNRAERLQLPKFDPVVRKYVLYR